MLSWKWIWIWVGLASSTWFFARRDEAQAPKPAHAPVVVAATRHPVTKPASPAPAAPIVSAAAAVAPPSTPGYTFDFAGAIAAPWFGPDQQNYASSFESVAIGDVTGDGRDDVVAWGYNVASGELYPATVSELLVYAQRPDGLLSAPARYPITIDWLNFVQLGDFNEDGRKDVLVLGQKTMQVFLSRPEGGFTTYTKAIWDPVELYSPTPAALMDVNRDGHLDLVFHLERTHAGNSPPGPSAATWSRLAVWYGDGRGAFLTRWSAVTWPTTNNLSLVEQAISLATGDINNDGIPELAIRVQQTTGEGYQHLIRFYGSNAAGQLVQLSTMEPRMELGTNYSAMDYLAFGDFNGDGRTDIAGSDGTMFNRIWVVHQSTTGKFNTTPVSRVGEPVGMVIRTADLDRNGADDMILAHDGQARASWLLQTSGQLAQSQMKENGGWDGRVNQTGLAVGDINGDGCPDAVMSYSYYGLQVMQGHNCGKSVRMPRAVRSAPSKGGTMRATRH